ncbi:MAG TPA: FAD-binding protein, partial [Flavobacteriales bacterium]|nr:FAD-binding protein [Flavobacteriales bacterium]
MAREFQIQVLPEDTINDAQLRKAIAKSIGVSETDLGPYRIDRRSIDARGRQVKFTMKITVFDPNEKIPGETYVFEAKNVSQAEEVHIIGAGPAGLFAALRVIELGKKPVIFERGKTVRDRRRDLAILTKNHIVNPESN